jgi:hypothetical protein
MGFLGGGTSGIHVPLDAMETLTGDIDADIDSLLSLDTVLDGDGLTNGDLPSLDVLADTGGDALPAIGLDLSSDDPQAGVESLLNVLDDIAADPEIESLLDGMLGNAEGGITQDIGGIEDFSDDILAAPGGMMGDMLGGGADAVDTDDDLSLDTGFNVIGIEMDEIDADAGLDAVEALVGDIDIDIGAGAVADAAGGGDIAGAAAGLDAEIDLLDGLLGEEGIDLFEEIGADTFMADDDDAGWPEASLLQGLDDGAGAILGGQGEVMDLPDPVGVLSDGLTPVIAAMGLGGASLGGLFG